MAFVRFSRTYRSLIRVKDIATVLTRHGFGHLVDSLNLRRYVPFLSRLRVAKPRDAFSTSDNLGQRLVLVMQELGPTFIKLGQVLSGRPDLLPEAVIAEFRTLQDNVPPFDSALARQTIEAELGQPIEEAFALFADEPIASGSIGQAHQGMLADGTDVIVKVRRPGIDRQIQTDVDLLQNLAALAERYVEELRVLRPMMIVEEFSRSLRKELDFVTEATFTAKFHTQLARVPGVLTPRVIWELTSPRVLTIEKLRGRNIGDHARLDELGLDRKKLAATLSSCFMTQYFEIGLFHADPHPGNILVDESGSIGLIDFGMVGHLSPTLKAQLSSIVLALIRHDVEMIAQIYADIGAFGETQDLDLVRGDLLELLDKYFGVPLDKVSAMDVFADLTRVARKHRVLLPPDFVLLGKSLVTVATVCRELDTEFSLAQAARPHLWPILRQKFSPLRMLNLWMLQSWNVLSLLQRLPGDAKLLLRQARLGELRFVQRQEGLEPLAGSIERGASRLALSIFIFGWLMACVMLGDQLERPWIGIGGFVLATPLSMWLLLDILRHRRY